MASEFPRSPSLLKGGLVVFGAPVPVPTNVIVFQYNPDSMSRGFQQQTETAVQQAARTRTGDTRRVLPPVETFDMTVDLDAADQLENGNALAIGTGIHPALAALELLLYPDSTIVVLNKALSLAGISQISSPKVPVVLLVWGIRVAPVQVTSISITEQAFDEYLNPTRATVRIGLRSLKEAELKDAGVPFETLALVQLIGKEVLAKTNVVAGAAELAGRLPF